MAGEARTRRGPGVEGAAEPWGWRCGEDVGPKFTVQRTGRQGARPGGAQAPADAGAARSASRPTADSDRQCRPAPALKHDQVMTNRGFVCTGPLAVVLVSTRKIVECTWTGHETLARIGAANGPAEPRPDRGAGMNYIMGLLGFVS